MGVGIPPWAVFFSSLFLDRSKKRERGAGSLPHKIFMLDVPLKNPYSILPGFSRFIFLLQKNVLYYFIELSIVGIP